MPLIIAILAAIAIAGAGFFGLGPTGKKLVEPIGPPGYSGPVCLTQESISSEVVLSQFPKATESNTPFPNSGGCAGGGCPGADFDDYLKILGAESVVFDQIWPNPPTTRLYKQTLPADSRFDPYRDMVYRASCNDWCFLNLPYGGTFHCDFIFLLKDHNHLIDRGGELYPKDCNNPDDPSTCAVFMALIRSGAEIPQKAKCQPSSPSSKNFLAQVFAQEESFIYLGGESYILVQEEPITLIKADLRSQAEGRTKVTDNVSFRGHLYEAYKNLTNKIALTDDFLYLVQHGIVDQADLPATDQYFQFEYLEFRKTPPKRPTAKTLQLGTFPVPVGKGWWRKWVDESKPAIYLYPEKPTQFRVILNPAGKLTVSDPPYDPEKGWEILALPDGSLYNFYNGYNHYNRYLFYEANLEKVFVKPEGFVVEGKDLVKFFQETLPKLGLNQKETQDFIDYWMTRLNENEPYYFIHFLDNDQIESLEPLQISSPTTYNDSAEPFGRELRVERPTAEALQPTTSIRIRAYFKPLKEKIEISPQTFPSPPERVGFTLVEWGGILDK